MKYLIIIILSVFSITLYAEDEKTWNDADYDIGEGGSFVYMMYYNKEEDDVSIEVDVPLSACQQYSISIIYMSVYHDSGNMILEVNKQPVKFKHQKLGNITILEEELVIQLLFPETDKGNNFVNNQFKTKDRVIFQQANEVIFDVTAVGFNTALSALQNMCVQEKEKQENAL